MLWFSRASVHLVRSTSLSHCRSADTTAPTQCTDGASNHPMLKDSLPKPYCSHLRERRMNHYPTVGSSGAKPPVLVRLCLDSNWASDKLMVSSVRPPDHLVLLSSLLLLRPTHLETGLSDHLSVSSSFFLLLPPSLNISIPSIQTQEITELVKDIYTPHFTLSTNSPPTHQLLYFCPYP
jgi:hypothetical protein